MRDGITALFAINMPIIELKASRYFVFYLAMIIAMTLFLCWSITAPAIAAARAGQPLPADWNWPAVIIFDLLFLLCGVVLIWDPIMQFRTVFSETGISKPGLIQDNFIAWQDISHVRISNACKQPWIIDIWSREKRHIRLNMLSYRKPEELIALIKFHAYRAQ